MDKLTRQNILTALKEIDKTLVEEIIDWPVAYCKDINNIRAIVLGCDPSNQWDKKLKYAFGIETTTPKLKLFFSGIESNLAEVGLSRNDVYIQNLCQNYFVPETSKNAQWKAAAKVWIPYLKEELDALPIDKDIPVFLTAGDLYSVLLKGGVKKYKPKDLYEVAELTPIKPSDNLLGRPLFPLFRGGHGYYDLKEWQGYAERVKGYLAR